MKKRALKLLALLTVLAVGGAIYTVVCKTIGFGIPCLVNVLTGLQCPGCGISRMFISLIEGDFVSAWYYNSCVLGMLPLFIYFAIRLSFGYVKKNSLNLYKAENIILVIMIVILLLFAVWRNLFGNNIIKT